MNSIVVHYQELALKGKNRPWFLGRLVRNLRRALSDLDVRSVRALMGRIEVVLGPQASPHDVSERLSRVFGIANFSYAGSTALDHGRSGPAGDLDAIAKAILADLGDRTCSSFRVSARRADKRFPMPSPQIEREVGGRIKEARGWIVNLDEPDLTIHVELLTDRAFYFFGKERGAGGLPTGTAGRVACLLSGGIDSPVAAHRMMKRGCTATFVHFHSYPILSRASQEKVRELVTLLTRWQQRSRVYLVAFGEIQQQVVLAVPGPMRVVVYRRLMMRIAEAIASVHADSPAARLEVFALDLFKAEASIRNRSNGFRRQMIHYGVTRRMQTTLARTTTGTGSDGQFGALEGPTWSEVEKLVADIKKSHGATSALVEGEFFRTARPGSLILPRFATPDEVESMAAYVASPLSSATNGVALRVEGSVARSNF